MRQNSASGTDPFGIKVTMIAYADGDATHVEIGAHLESGLDTAGVCRKKREQIRDWLLSLASGDKVCRAAGNA
jgi:hypothetical protein